MISYDVRSIALKTQDNNMVDYIDSFVEIDEDTYAKVELFMREYNIDFDEAINQMMTIAGIEIGIL